MEKRLDEGAGAQFPGAQKPAKVFKKKIRLAAQHVMPVSTELAFDVLRPVQHGAQIKMQHVPWRTRTEVFIVDDIGERDYIVRLAEVQDSFDAFRNELCAFYANQDMQLVSLPAESMKVGMLCVLLMPTEEPYRAFIETINREVQQVQLVLVDYAERYLADIHDLAYLDERFLDTPVTAFHVKRDPTHPGHQRGFAQGYKVFMTVIVQDKEALEAILAPITEKTNKRKKARGPNQAQVAEQFDDPWD
ncbi:hypothetical protein AAVH_02589 [Aphelenchoides avenae]|nr:hypothetical protein AAVH_02589 [Aphelenchus avenae]